MGLIAIAGVSAGGLVAALRRTALDDRLGIQPVDANPSRRSIGIRVPAAVAAAAVTWIAGPVAGAIAIGAVVAAAWALGRRRAARAARLRADGIAEVAAALAAGLRAGLSLTQSIAYARDESAGPVRRDLDRLVAALELGEPVGESLLSWADETGSDDARLVAGVVDLHRRTGGDLPSVLDGVVTTLRDRLAAGRELRAPTAQARLSGTILGALPIAFFGFLLLTSRHDMLAAIATPLGRTAVAVGLILELLAFAWIRRLLAVR